MDPLTALATITQLLGLFVQERRDNQTLTKQQFLDWLGDHRHEELKDLISNTHHLSEQVDAILHADHLRILEEIRAVNTTLAQVMSRLQSIGSLAGTLAPTAALSTFALAALCHFEDSKATHMITLPDDSGVQFGNDGEIKHEEPRFLKDDMETLEGCGFIRMTVNHGAYAVYELTRNGAAYARLVVRES